MAKKIIITAIFLSIISTDIKSMPQQRDIPDRPDIQSVNIRFNGENIRGFYLLLDFRTEAEQQRDLEEGETAGDVIIFLHGHAQRPGDAYSLTSKLAHRSKSGIVIIPVCDTPYGKDKKWRGDRGKEVVLMEISRFALKGLNIGIKGYRPITKKNVEITPRRADEPCGDEPVYVFSKAAFMGWSHGALLSRRLAHSYPDAANSLVQMAPAGYAEWGRNSCTRTACLSGSFFIEGLRIGKGIFRGEAGNIFDSSTGIIRGVTGDTMRSCSSCLWGNFHPLKPFRAKRDIAETATYATNDNFPLENIDYITVIFAEKDGLFRADRLGGIEDRKEPTMEEEEAFFEKYYTSSIRPETYLNLKVLPGTHIGPSVYSDEYSRTALESINQIISGE